MFAATLSSRTAFSSVELQKKVNSLLETRCQLCSALDLWASVVDYCEDHEKLTNLIGWVKKVSSKRHVLAEVEFTLLSKNYFYAGRLLANPSGGMGIRQFLKLLSSFIKEQLLN